MDVFKKLQRCTAIYLIVLFLLLFMCFTVLRVQDLSTLSMEKLCSTPQSLNIYDSSGRLVSYLDGGENRVPTALSDLPAYVKNAFIAAEDTRFYTHCGIDIKRIFGAVYYDFKSGNLAQGGSTITQQLIKNSHLTNEKSVLRKLNEAYLAVQLEAVCSKDEILEMYLNYIYFGGRAYGIEAAARTYFGKGAAALSLAEAALLAGVIKAPSRYAPHIDLKSSVGRRNHVLSLMEKQGFINSDECAAATSEQPDIKYAPQSEFKYGYYTDELLKSSAALLSITLEELLTGGYSIYSALDQKAQGTLEELMFNGELYPDAEAQGAAVVLDSATGGICAAVGGRSYDLRLGFDRAVMMRRSPGSAIKPVLVYSPAIEERVITAATVLTDQRKSFNGYCPQNYKNKYYGAVTARQALIKSLNTPAVEILSMTGVEKAKQYAHKAGIEFDESDNSLCLALGGFTYGISPLALAGAYRVLADGGVYTPPYYIEKITDRVGNVVYSRSRSETQVFSPGTAYIVSDILNQAAQRRGTAFYGVSNDICAKTGTVACGDGNSDAWVAAFNLRYTVAVWIGYDIASSTHCMSAGVTGSTYPSRIAASIFGSLCTGTATPPPPDDIVAVSLDSDSLVFSGSALLSTRYTPENRRLSEIFLCGTEPCFASIFYSEPVSPEITVMPDQLRRPVISFAAANSYTVYRLYKIRDECQLLYTLQGDAGEVLSYCDVGWQHGDEYFIIPEHKSVTVNGIPLTGRAGSRVSFCP